MADELISKEAVLKILMEKCKECSDKKTEECICVFCDIRDMYFDIKSLPGKENNDENNH